MIANDRRWLWCLLLGGLASPLNAHPFHSSHGEAEWNGESMALEVALALDANDLEQAVRQHADVDTSLEAAEMQPALWEYVQSHFGVQEEGERDASLHWVGLEVTDDGTAWIYFEAKLKRPPTDQLQVTHRLLLDSSEGQQNFLTLTVADRVETRVFSGKHPARTFGVKQDGEPSELPAAH